MKRVAQVCFGVALFLLVGGSAAEAATLYIDPHARDAFRGDVVSLALRLDVDEDECINTVDATINYTDNIRAVDVSRGNSILSLWVEEPVINETERTITFAGGIPNGYCGRVAGDPRLTNIIAELLFSVPGLSIGRRESGNSAEITFGPETQILLNDGEGTIAPLQTFDATVTLSDSPGTTTQNDWQRRIEADRQAPEEFSVSLVQKDDVFSGKYYIAFSTTDKQSGLDHFEVIEEPIEEMNLFRWGSPEAPWVVTESPYVLTDQTLNSVIRVKAIDKAGNERIAVLIPDESLRTRQIVFAVVFGVAIVVLMVVLVGTGVYLWRRKKRNNITSEVIEEE